MGIFVPMAELPVWATGEEKINAITHLPGILFSAVGLFLMVKQAMRMKDRTRLISSIIFGGALTNLYIVSVTYHAYCEECTVVKKALRYLDHLSIFLVIAGSYTPFALIGVSDRLGRFMFWLIWMIAFAGMIMKVLRFDDFEEYNVLYFFAMGWTSLIMAKKLIKNLSWSCLAWLGIGGLSYSLGAIFYVELYPYAHAIWHLFVMGGSFSHIIAVYRYL